MKFSNYQAVGFGGYHLTPWVKRLMIINAAAFVITMIVGREMVFDIFAFQPARVLTRPWGAVTYMFLHYDFWHLLLNMLVLFFFGPPLEDRWGSREFIRFWMICGMGGAALSFLFASYTIVGASAAAYGVMLAFALNWPDVPIYIWGIFPVKAKWLVAFLFVTSMFSAFGSEGGGVAHFAHLGGLAAGFLYLKADWRIPSGAGKVKKKASSVRVAIMPGPAKVRGRKASGEGEDPRAARPRGWKDDDESALLDRVDAVLDKISATGMASLTDEERNLLDEVSRRHKTN